MGGIGSAIGGLVGSVVPGVGTALGAGLGGALGGMVGGNGGSSSSANNTGSGGAIQSAFGSPASTYSKNPNWINDASQQVYNQASTAAAQPYQSYTGQRVAPLNEGQTNAYYTANAEVGGLNPGFDNAYNKFTSASSPYTQTYTPTTVGYTPVSAQQNNQTISTPDFTQANITGYMSPYLQASLQPQLNNINQAYAQRQNKENAAAAGAGVFGGSRQAVNNALITKQQQDELNGVTAQGYNNAFNTAASNFQADQGRNLQGQEAQANINQNNNALNLQGQLANQNAGINTGEFNQGQNAAAFNTNANIYATNRAANLASANGLTSLLGTQQNINNSQLNNLQNAAAVEQNQRQQQDNVDYQNFLEQRGWNQQQASYLNNLLKGSPSAGSIQGMQGVLPNNGIGNLSNAITQSGLPGIIKGWFDPAAPGSSSDGSGVVTDNSLNGYLDQNNYSLPSINSGQLYNPDNLTGITF